MLSWVRTGTFESLEKSSGGARVKWTGGGLVMWTGGGLAISTGGGAGITGDDSSSNTICPSFAGHVIVPGVPGVHRFQMSHRTLAPKRVWRAHTHTDTDTHKHTHIHTCTHIHIRVQTQAYRLLRSPRLEQCDQRKDFQSG